MWGRPLLYERLTWPEVRRAAAEDRVCLIPVGTLEDHGPHLPVDTDDRIITEICRRAAEEDPDAVAMDKAVDEQGYPAGDNARLEWWADGPLRYMPWWSSFSRSGVQGSPTLATAEKGKRFLEAAVEECVSYVRELLQKPLPERRQPQEKP